MSKKRKRKIVPVPEKKPSLLRRFFSRIKTYLFTGILVTAPVGITFYIAYNLIIYIDKWSNAIVPPKFRLKEYLGFDVPGLGVAVIITALILIGMFTTGYVGRFFVKLGEKIVSKISKHFFQAKNSHLIKSFCWNIRVKIFGLSVL